MGSSANENPLHLDENAASNFSLWDDVLKKSSPSLDCTFRFSDGSTMKAHSNIVQAKSTFFGAMFSSGMSESVTKDVVIECDAHVFCALLQFLYLDKIEPLPVGQDLCDLLALANFHSQDSLITWVLEHADKDHIIPCAEVLCHLEAVKIPLSFRLNVGICMPELVDDADKLTKPVLVFLLKLSASHGSPLDCFHFLEKWLKAHGVEKMGFEDIKEMLLLLNFPKMPVSHFVDVVMKSGLLPQEEMLNFRRQITLFTKDYSRLSSDDFIPIPPANFFWDHRSSLFFGIALSPNDDKLVYVTEKTSQSVYVINVHSRGIHSKFRLPGSQPAGISISESNEVFVCDENSNQVEVFTIHGDFIRRFGSEVLCQPCGISIHHASHQVHVCSTDNHICVFEESSTLQFSYGRSHLESPQGVAVDGIMDLVFVVDCSDKVKIFTTQGDFIREFCHGGRSNFVCVDPYTRHVIVSDMWAHRIQVFTYEGKPVGGIGRGFEQQSKLKEVFGVAVTKEGRLLACIGQPEPPQTHNKMWELPTYNFDDFSFEEDEHLVVDTEKLMDTFSDFW